MKIKKIIYKMPIILALFLVLFLVCSFPFQYIQESLPGVSLIERMVVFCVLSVIVILLYKKRKQIEEILQKRKIFIIALTTIVLLQCIVIIVFKVQPINDLLYLHDEAIRMLNDSKVSMESFNGYFQKYPNNYGYLIFLHLFYKILRFIHIPTTCFVSASIILNTFCIDLGILFTMFIGNRIKGMKMMNLISILFMITPWTYFWVFYYYTHTFSFMIVMLSCYLFVMLSQENVFGKKLILAILIGIVCYLGMKIRVTNLFVFIAFGFTFIVFQKSINKKKIICFCFLLGVLAAFTTYGIKTKNMLPKGETNSFPMTHWIMMASHGNGRYDFEDIQYTSQFKSKNEKIEANINKTKDNIKKLGWKGTCRLVGIKLKAVWLVGDDDFTKMSYSCKKYTRWNEFLNGDKSGWILMYSYLVRFLILILVLLEFIHLIYNHNFWEYFFAIILLGGMTFHCIWEANPKYSICFTGIMILLAAFQLDRKSIEKKKNKVYKKYFFYQSILFLGIVLLQPGYNYLKNNPISYDENYSAFQMSSNKNLVVELEENDTLEQSIEVDSSLSQIQMNIQFYAENSNVKIQLLNKRRKIVYQEKVSNLSMNNNLIVWKLPHQVDEGQYTIRFISEENEKVSFPIYSTGNYDVYSSGSFIMNGNKKSWTDMLFILYK